jgi:hypothetical protein
MDFLSQDEDDGDEDGGGGGEDETESPTFQRSIASIRSKALISHSFSFVLK